MIPEQAKLEIKKRRDSGATWTALAKWVAQEYGIDVHRTTLQRWHDKEVFLEFEDAFPRLEEDLEDKDTPEERIKLDKKVATHKAEAVFYKKLYEQAVKDSTKKEIIVEAIKNNALKISSGDFGDEFPVDVFQTGSGTSTNMNMNEVIANLNNGLVDSKFIVPWENFKNTLMVTNSDGLNKIPTRIYKIIKIN